MIKELNKKLAEWAGFRYLEGMWTIYDEDVLEPTLPNFTQSLDACFKWLVPKLLEIKMKVRLSINTSVVTHRSPQATLVSMDKKYNKQNRLQICANAETPALALCLAIEKLIEKGD